MRSGLGSLYGAVTKRKALTLAMLLAFSACGSPSEEEVQKEFDDFVASRNACTMTDDCVLASTGCPLGCGTAVNRVHQAAVEAKGRELVADYESGGQKCYYDCQVLVPACMDGRCVANPQ